MKLTITQPVEREIVLYKGVSNHDGHIIYFRKYADKENAYAPQTSGNTQALELDIKTILDCFKEQKIIFKGFSTKKPQENNGYNYAILDASELKELEEKFPSQTNLEKKVDYGCFVTPALCFDVMKK